MVSESVTAFGRPPKAPDASLQTCLQGGTQASPLSVLDVFGLDSPVPSEYSPNAFLTYLGPARKEADSCCHHSAASAPSIAGHLNAVHSPPPRRRSRPRTEGLRPAFSRSSSLNEKKVLRRTSSPFLAAPRTALQNCSKALQKSNPWPVQGLDLAVPFERRMTSGKLASTQVSEPFWSYAGTVGNQPEADAQSDVARALQL